MSYFCFPSREVCGCCRRQYLWCSCAAWYSQEGSWCGGVYRSLPSGMGHQEPKQDWLWSGWHTVSSVIFTGLVCGKLRTFWHVELVAWYGSLFILLGTLPPHHYIMLHYITLHYITFPPPTPLNTFLNSIFNEWSHLNLNPPIYCYCYYYYYWN